MTSEHRTIGDPAMTISRIDVLFRPQRGQAAIVRVALDQVLGNHRSPHLATGGCNYGSIRPGNPLRHAGIAMGTTRLDR